MSSTILSSRQFNQDTGKAKKAAEHGPVVITDRGKPAHVLISYAEYRRLTGSPRKITDLLAEPEGVTVEWAFPASRDLPRAAEFD